MQDRAPRVGNDFANAIKRGDCSRYKRFKTRVRRVGGLMHSGPCQRLRGPASERGTGDVWHGAFVLVLN